MPLSFTQGLPPCISRGEGQLGKHLGRSHTHADIRRTQPTTQATISGQQEPRASPFFPWSPNEACTRTERHWEGPSLGYHPADRLGRCTRGRGLLRVQICEKRLRGDSSREGRRKRLGVTARACWICALPGAHREGSSPLQEEAGGQR